MTEWLGYILRKKKEAVFLIFLIMLQVIIFLPLAREITQPKKDFERLKRENVPSKEDNINEFSFLEGFETKPIGYYFSKGAKDLFIKKNNPEGKVENKVRFSYVGLFRTEKEAHAMIKDETTGKSHFKREGEMIGDFKVIQIKRENITLSDSGGNLVILSKGGKGE